MKTPYENTVRKHRTKKYRTKHRTKHRTIRVFLRKDATPKIDNFIHPEIVHFHPESWSISTRKISDRNIPRQITSTPLKTQKSTFLAKRSRLAAPKNKHMGPKCPIRKITFSEMVEMNMIWHWKWKLPGNGNGLKIPATDHPGSYYQLLTFKS